MSVSLNCSRIFISPLSLPNASEIEMYPGWKFPFQISASSER